MKRPISKKVYGLYFVKIFMNLTDPGGEDEIDQVFRIKLKSLNLETKNASASIIAVSRIEDRFVGKTSRTTIGKLCGTGR